LHVAGTIYSSQSVKAPIGDFGDLRVATNAITALTSGDSIELIPNGAGTVLVKVSSQTKLAATSQVEVYSTYTSGNELSLKFNNGDTNLGQVRFSEDGFKLTNGTSALVPLFSGNFTSNNLFLSESRISTIDVDTSLVLFPNGAGRVTVQSTSDLPLVVTRSHATLPAGILLQNSGYTSKLIGASDANKLQYYYGATELFRATGTNFILSGLATLTKETGSLLLGSMDGSRVILSSTSGGQAQNSTTTALDTTSQLSSAMVLTAASFGAKSTTNGVALEFALPADANGAPS